MAGSLLDLWRHEPVRCISILAAAVVFVAARAGVVIDEQSLRDALLVVAPILLGGETARGYVIPLHKIADKNIPADQTDVPR